MPVGKRYDERMTSVLPFISARSVVGTPPEVALLDSPPFRAYFFVRDSPSSWDSTISKMPAFWVTFSVSFRNVLAVSSLFRAVKAYVAEKLGFSWATAVIATRSEQQIDIRFPGKRTSHVGQA